MESSKTGTANMEKSNAQPAEGKHLGRHGRGAPRKQWKDLTSAQRTRIVAQAAIQFALVAWALWDISHRPANKIKGSKRLWALAAFVQPVGPIAYFLFGRKG